MPCRSSPSFPLPGIARPSESSDRTIHGQKLYSVFVKNHDAYPNGPHTDQAVVKQSWTANLVSGSDAGFDPGSVRSQADASDHFYPYAEKDGGVYRAGAPAGLFIMFRLDSATPETDEGWVYATVYPAGEVTSAGRVASCRGCHERTPLTNACSASHSRRFSKPARSRAYPITASTGTIAPWSPSSSKVRRVRLSRATNGHA